MINDVVLTYLFDLEDGINSVGSSFLDSEECKSILRELIMLNANMDFPLRGDYLDLLDMLIDHVNVGDKVSVLRDISSIRTILQ